MQAKQVTIDELLMALALAQCAQPPADEHH